MTSTNTPVSQWGMMLPSIKIVPKMSQKRALPTRRRLLRSRKLSHAKTHSTSPVST
jgi:hypothetical protein